MEEENKIIKRKRGRPRKADSQVSTTKAKQVIKEANELLGKKPRRGRPPGSKDKKRRKRKTRAELRRIEAIRKGQARKRKPETCGVKIVAVIVRVDGDSRVKIKRDEMPELAPCEKLVSRITFEKDGIPVHSVFKEVRNFAETLAKCAGEKLLQE